MTGLEIILLVIWAGALLALLFSGVEYDRLQDRYSYLEAENKNMLTYIKSSDKVKKSSLQRCEKYCNELSKVNAAMRRKNRTIKALREENKALAKDFDTLYHQIKSQP